MHFDAQYPSSFNIWRCSASVCTCSCILDTPRAYPDVKILWVYIPDMLSEDALKSVLSVCPSEMATVPGLAHANLIVIEDVLRLQSDWLV